jgi:hypothetical protein
MFYVCSFDGSRSWEASQIMIRAEAAEKALKASKREEQVEDVERMLAVAEKANRKAPIEDR